MADLRYVKLANVTADIADGDLLRADLLAGIEADEIIVVNLKGLMLTEAEVIAHLDGTKDGETLEPRR